MHILAQSPAKPAVKLNAPQETPAGQPQEPKFNLEPSSPNEHGFLYKASRFAVASGVSLASGAGGLLIGGIRHANQPTFSDKALDVAGKVTRPTGAILGGVAGAVAALAGFPLAPVFGAIGGIVMGTMLGAALPVATDAAISSIRGMAKESVKAGAAGFRAGKVAFDKVAGWVTPDAKPPSPPSSDSKAEKPDEPKR